MIEAFKKTEKEKSLLRIYKLLNKSRRKNYYGADAYKKHLNAPNAIFTDSFKVKINF